MVRAVNGRYVYGNERASDERGKVEWMRTVFVIARPVASLTCSSLCFMESCSEYDY